MNKIQIEDIMRRYVSEDSISMSDIQSLDESQIDELSQINFNDYDEMRRDEYEELKSKTDESLWQKEYGQFQLKWDRNRKIVQNLQKYLYFSLLKTAEKSEKWSEELEEKIVKLFANIPTCGLMKGESYGDIIRENERVKRIFKKQIHIKLERFGIKDPIFVGSQAFSGEGACTAMSCEFILKLFDETSKQGGIDQIDYSKLKNITEKVGEQFISSTKDLNEMHNNNRKRHDYEIYMTPHHQPTFTKLFLIDKSNHRFNYNETESYLLKVLEGIAKIGEQFIVKDGVLKDFNFQPRCSKKSQYKDRFGFESTDSNETVVHLLRLVTPFGGHSMVWIQKGNDAIVYDPSFGAFHSLESITKLWNNIWKITESYDVYRLYEKNSKGYQEFLDKHPTSILSVPDEFRTLLRWEQNILYYYKDGNLIEGFEQLPEELMKNDEFLESLFKKMDSVIKNLFICRSFEDYRDERLCWFALKKDPNELIHIPIKILTGDMVYYAIDKVPELYDKLDKEIKEKFPRNKRFCSIQ